MKAATALPAPAAGLRRYTADGARKYVIAGERDAFLREAECANSQGRTLCMTLAYAGCRLSEALGLSVDRVDLLRWRAGVRDAEEAPGGDIYRAVSVPPALLDALDPVHASASFSPAAEGP